MGIAELHQCSNTRLNQREAKPLFMDIEQQAGYGYKALLGVRLENGKYPTLSLFFIQPCNDA
ncbi:hypothetical protein EAE89_02720 [Photorhabdus heterorhabditis]|nr:hypothetical protein [Photorhabdus heterorhabditis]